MSNWSYYDECGTFTEKNFLDICRHFRYFVKGMYVMSLPKGCVNMQNEQHLKRIYRAARQFREDYRNSHGPEFDSELELVRAITDYEIMVAKRAKLMVDRLMAALQTADAITVETCLDFMADRDEMPDLETRRQIITLGLGSVDLQIRDIIMGMAAHWADPECLDLLEQHQEPVGWLDEYRVKVIAVLKEHR